MKTRCFSSFLFLIILLAGNSVTLQAQNVSFMEIGDMRFHDSGGLLDTLASPEFEGRETGSPGGDKAAEFIALKMREAGLHPLYANPRSSGLTADAYFQSFSLLRYSLRSASITLGIPGGKKPGNLLRADSDFTVENPQESFQHESVLVYAGYGIPDLKLDDDDYAGLDVKGKIVVFTDGYPGQYDTLSVQWEKYRELAADDGFDCSARCREASGRGVVAVIVIRRDYRQLSADLPLSVGVGDEQPYQDVPFGLPEDKVSKGIPCMYLSREGSRKMANFLGLYAKNAPRQRPEAGFCRIQGEIKIEPIRVQNVIGILPGRDTNRVVIIGGHYDHLGKRGHTIYYGSDDNASGTAGMLSMAREWSSTDSLPPCTLMFASWTAEEKGLIGSEYFVRNLPHSDKVKLYINLDMISRSVSEDSSGRMLSIGTRTADSLLRQTAGQINTGLTSPFILDLWDVTGHSGSDYASFTARGIPVMTFNTGLHNDYHTTRDLPALADVRKMNDVLNLASECLKHYLTEIRIK
jgi:hypothetical protein